MNDGDRLGFFRSRSGRLSAGGKGSSSTYSGEAVPMVLLLSLYTGQGRTRALSTFELFLLRFPMSWGALRQAISWSIDEAERRNRTTHERGELAIAREVHRRATRALSDGSFPILRELEEAATRRLRQARRRDLKQAAASQFDAAIYNDEFGADLMTELLRKAGFGLLADRMGPVFIQAELEGVENPPDIRSLLETTTFEGVKAARMVARMCQNLFFFMDSAAMMGEQAAITLVSRLRDDVRAQELRYFFGSSPSEWNLLSIGIHLVIKSHNRQILNAGWRFSRDEWISTHRAYANAAERLGLLTAKQWNGLNQNLSVDVSEWPNEIVIEPDATEAELRQHADFLLAERRAGRALWVAPGVH